MKIRYANTRGLYKTDWIESRRTFSNNMYWDPKYMNWGNIKVINDDILQPNKMVPKHEHKNYDILGYLVEGELEHWDTLGNIRRAKPGQIQHMWCGSSIWHTEKCVSETPARYLQIWITPTQKNTTPYYEIYEKGPGFEQLNIDIKQKIKIFGGELQESRNILLNKEAYFYVVKGTAIGKDFSLSEGDGAELDPGLFSADFNGHFLLFENI